MSACSSGVMASSGGNVMFCGSRRSRTFDCAKLPPYTASPPSTINVTASTTPAVLINWSQLFLFMTYPFLPWACPS